MSITVREPPEMTAVATEPVRRRRRRSSTRPVWQEEPGPLVQALKVLLAIFLTIVMLFPFIYVVAVSFSSVEDVVQNSLILIPKHPTLEAYRAILRGGVVLHSLYVSIGITLVGTAFNMVLTTALAFGLSRPGVPGRTFVLVLVLFTLLFGPGIIPSYLLVKELGILDTYSSLILPTAISAFNLIVLRNFIMSLPNDLIESARLDGASDWRVLWNVILPLSKPVLAVIALFYGVAHWNDFFMATLYLNDQSKWPIQLVLRQYVLQGSALAGAIQMNPNAPPPPVQTIQMAVVVIATVPILLVYPFLQKYFTQGVLTGAIKG